ncbi:RNA polymerase sigma-54 factor [Ruixingdingia sedimenti]|uniref:RNA polymerase sigma-54 factor n=1 Tax=Ruixingdingia sedimenti TaxID=3073604 RepID=A0ABU1FEE0_9RHOB|nr:RNA polymerase sigma-54 factor [Xinfangfangia sp. LG-4]MDR5655263.1 RNA polymerase sigma-54 factor [Xinfangfangia sp. LG-4]
MARLGNGVAMRQRARIALSPAMRQELDLLRMTNAELTQHLQRLAEANPWIALSRRAVFGSGFAAGQEGPAQAEVAAAGPSLYAHVSRHVAALFPPGPARDLALHFLDVLEPSGWLGAPVAEVARRAGAGEAEALAVLARLQRIEPRGLFARSLAECLRLQAEEAGELDAVMAVLLDRLDLLAAGDLATLARLAGVAEAEVAARARALRRLDPKPGAHFAAAPAPPPACPKAPDLRVVRDAGGDWQVMLDDLSLPLATLRDGPAEDRARREAARVLAMVERRNATLLRIVAAIAQRQAAALEGGAERLRPLRQADLAEDLGLHESTVSRALAGLRIGTPGGEMPVTAFFSGTAADGVAVAQVRAALARLVAAEDPAAPLGDGALAERLADEGLAVARRTVAKYRGQLGIPPAAARARDGAQDGTRAACESAAPSARLRA